MANSIWGGGRRSLKNFYYVVQRVSDQNNWLVEGQKNVPPHTHTHCNSTKIGRSSSRINLCDFLILMYPMKIWEGSVKKNQTSAAISKTRQRRLWFSIDWTCRVFLFSRCDYGAIRPPLTHHLWSPQHSDVSPADASVPFGATLVQQTCKSSGFLPNASRKVGGPKHHLMLVLLKKSTTDCFMASQG